jgi:GNAT superfamily N-acetyltransferase
MTLCGSRRSTSATVAPASAAESKRWIATFDSRRGRTRTSTSLPASVVDVTDIADELARKLPRYPQLPVTLIGRIAVDARLKGRGCGSLLLMDALRRSLAHLAEVAAMAVIVDANDDAAAGFYRHFDFRPLQTTPRRMYLPMKTVASVLS